jgi:hypothetical protein
MSAVTLKTHNSPIGRFQGAKTSEPMLVRTYAVLDTLIVAALDPTVRAITPAVPIAVNLNGIPVLHLPDCCLLTDHGSIVVDVNRSFGTPGNRKRFDLVAETLANLGIKYECREPLRVHSSPLLMNSRSVWSCRRVQISAADQVRVLDLVGSDPLPLGQVAQAVRADDGVPAILALACHAILQLDLKTAPLGPDTRVWRRKPSLCSPDSMSEQCN